MEIELTKGLKAIIDDDDYELVRPYRWAVTGSKPGYLYAVHNHAVDGKRVALLMHRLITNAKPGEVVDHIDHNTMNNRRSNLRVCSHAENMRNRKLNANSSTGVKGVMVEACGKGYRRLRASVRVDGKRHRRWFNSIEEAAAWATEMRSKLHGEFAYQPEQDKS